MEEFDSFTTLQRGNQFTVYVSKDNFKFNAAHFIAFKGYREHLHGHNYRVGLKIWGQRGDDGYVLDFTLVKKTIKQICKTLNESMIVPMRSDVLKITDEEPNIKIACEDGSKFSFPKQDCKLLPIMHSSAEELAEFILWRTINHFSEEYLVQQRKIVAMELSVAEAENQYATHYVDLTKGGRQQTTFSGAPCPSYKQ